MHYLYHLVSENESFANEPCIIAVWLANEESAKKNACKIASAKMSTLALAYFSVSFLIWLAC
jgi:hypothetical protein